MANGPTEAELVLVVRHGTGPIVRALAIVILAKRKGREEDLRQILN